MTVLVDGARVFKHTVKLSESRRLCELVRA